MMNLSKVVGYKAVDYLNGYMEKKAAGNPADAVHALSEGYGFILSLMFTNDGTGKPYFSESEVNSIANETSYSTVSENNKSSCGCYSSY